MNKIAFLFPGQGTQYEGMLDDLPKTTLTSSLLERAQNRLGHDPLLLDDQEYINTSVGTQLSLFIKGVVLEAHLEEENIYPHVVAGHSIGSFAAAVAAKVLSFEDGLYIVKKRAELMDNVGGEEYGMGVVVGVNKEKLVHMVESIHNETTPVYIANENAEDQYTVSGKRIGIEVVLEKARKQGASKAKFLNMTVPSHCPLMDNVGKTLFDELEKCPISDPTVPFIGNKNARPLQTGSTVKEDLAFNVSHPVLWHNCSTIMKELGVKLFVEMAPGHVLVDLIKRKFPEGHFFPLSSFSLDDVLFLVQKYKSK